MPSAIDARFFHRHSRATNPVRIERGFECDLDHDRLRVEVLREDILRVKISRAGFFEERPSFAICADTEAMRADFSLELGPERIRLVTGKMTLTVSVEPFRMEARRGDGSLIFETAMDEEGRSLAYATLNDEFLTERLCGLEDAFFGLGEKTGRFNRKGRDFTLWNTDVLSPDATGEFVARFPPGDERADPRGTEFDPYYVSIPFFYHMPHPDSAMAGFFFDNPFRARFEFSDPLRHRIHFSGGQYTEYIFAGPEMSGILKAYTMLTGRMEPPPLWALGHHQCRWFAYTQDRVEALGERHRERKIPCDALWLDIDYMDGYRVFTWDRERFPDVEGMLGRLRKKGFRVVTIIDPGVKYEPGYAVFDEALDKNLLCEAEYDSTYVGQVWPGRTAFPDFSLPETRAWWGRLNAAHVRSGLAGIWNDMNEPATGEIPPDAMKFTHGKFPHAQFHNQYGMLMAMGTTEGLLAAMPEQRTFVLSRAGSAGIQRYAANWMGDNCSRWEHLWMSMPMALGFGISGQPFLGSDVGGFMEDAAPEMLARWHQYGALTPFCRNHNSANQKDQYPWVFGEAVEAVCRSAIDLRYRLMPYIYSQFIQASETGAPVQQPLLFLFQDDPAARECDDQYLFGDHLLVAPIYQEGVTRRAVYLPSGTWHCWNTREIFSGPRSIMAEAPLNLIPLYVRGGAVIPMWPAAPASTMNHHPETILLHLFLPEEEGETRSTLHEDDGATLARREGAFYRTEFVLRKVGSEITLEASVSGGGYPEFSRTEFRILIHGEVRDEVSIDGKPARLSADGILVANRGGGFTLRANLV